MMIIVIVMLIMIVFIKLVILTVTLYLEGTKGVPWNEGRK